MSCISIHSICLPAALEKIAHVVIAFGHQLEGFFYDLLLHVFVLEGDRGWGLGGQVLYICVLLIRNECGGTYKVLIELGQARFPMVVEHQNGLDHVETVVWWVLLGMLLAEVKNCE